jgi:uncharacterized membrane protein YobD (UPF0266 family)
MTSKKGKTMLPARLRQQSTFTGLGACLFFGAVVILFFALYHERARVPLFATAAILFVATLICWAASAGAEKRGI